MCALALPGNQDFRQVQDLDAAPGASFWFVVLGSAVVPPLAAWSRNRKPPHLSVCTSYFPVIASALPAVRTRAPDGSAIRYRPPERKAIGVGRRLPRREAPGSRTSSGSRRSGLFGPVENFGW